MAYLLDTNIISELQKGARAHPSVQGWFAQTPYEALFLSVLVIGELQQGIARLRRRDTTQANRLAEKLQSLESSFQDRILPITTPIARRWADNNVPDPLPLIDGLLAATAQEHGLILVTRNVRDVAPSGVATLNPFEQTAYTPRLPSWRQAFMPPPLSEEMPDRDLPETCARPRSASFLKPRPRPCIGRSPSCSVFVARCLALSARPFPPAI